MDLKILEKIDFQYRYLDYQLHLAPTEGGGQ